MAVKTKKMKGVELFCASPASTSICKSTVTKPLHRLNSYLGDRYKNLSNNLSNSNCSPSSSPCISQLPLTPRKLGRSDPNPNTPRRKSSADVYDLRNYHKHTTNYTSNNYGHSSRHLLGEYSPFLGSVSSDLEKDYESSALLPTTSLGRSEERELRKSRSVDTGRIGFGSLMNVAHKEANNKKKPMSLALANLSNQRVIKSGHSIINDYDSPAALKSSSLAHSPEQVVTLRVSLHCKACEAKLSKHLSKMEGVTSFSIDKETKKVVVIGKMTPSDVLASISKVKNAQFWQSPSSGFSSSSSSSTTSLKTGSTAMSEANYLR